MKNKPLSVQIGVVLTGATLLFSVLITILIFFTLRHFFMEETYRMIESAQETLLSDSVAGSNPIELDQSLQSNRAVNHLIFTERGRVRSETALPVSIIRYVRTQALSQEAAYKRYEGVIDGERMYYVIKKGNTAFGEVILISYVWDSYLTELVRTLFSRLLFIIVAALLLIWLPALWLANYLTKPLRQMQSHVKQIANRHWHEPLEMKRQDEIGNLAESIEVMRKTLIQQDDLQQATLQNISHELKTPIMVIHSYADAILDGVFPKNDLQGTVYVIKEEAERLEKRVKDLLYLTKLDYYETKEAKQEYFHIKELLIEILDRLHVQRPGINIQVDVFNELIYGNEEQWKVAFENIIDNGLRYAKSCLSISAVDDKTIKIWNDGPQIEEAMKNSLFKKFNKGKGGKFGLGLAIVERVAELHQAKVFAENENNGVAFYIHFSK
ncbi:sensor histidine kinase [Bacillus sp. HMF5848]|uniref:sensor histidine kinase n=1 Tax=Bacillus sp. HMF5848 TaxID=2495421 RepID=UPI000F79AC01|nr:HAMP domain-containing sensor histidine kinase [Bacillus sp. HMF5848]RSK26054.1 sensor histidine kinase [Bacillus sp. HMF5848]